MCHNIRGLDNGLSPRIRGTEPLLLLLQLKLRFIPAYTGNGSPYDMRMIDQTVYPRVYGERLFRAIHPVLVAGLSPRIRGTVVYVAAKGVRMRFIPAYTGNGVVTGVGTIGAAVYPRVYGERATCVR